MNAASLFTGSWLVHWAPRKPYNLRASDPDAHLGDGAEMPPLSASQRWVSDYGKVVLLSKPVLRIYKM